MSDSRLLQLAIASLTDVDCPSAEQLAEYTLGTLSGIEQLQVAAHVRDCPICQHIIAICAFPAYTKDAQAAAAAAMYPRFRFPVRVARLIPLASASGMRGANEHVRQYRSADIVVDLTWTPPDGDSWHITGRVLRGEKPLADQEIVLRTGRRRLMATSDTTGFFTFPAVPAGRYTLAIETAGIEVQLRGIILSHDES